MRPLSEIARIDEALCALACGQIAPESIEIAGGRAYRSEPGSWINRAEGLGFAGPVTAEDIARLTGFFHSAGLDAQVKACPYAHETLFARLAEAGYTLKRFEQIMFRAIDPADHITVPHPLPPDIEIRTVDRADDALVREVAAMIVNTFATPERPALDSDIELSARAVRRPDSLTLGAFVGGVCVAAGGLEWLEDLATLYGLVVSPAHRRRGIQQAMIAARLNHAIERGFKIATIGCSPGIPTERNARRFGFQVAYTRSVMVKPLAR